MTAPVPPRTPRPLSLGLALLLVVTALAGPATAEEAEEFREEALREELGAFRGSMEDAVATYEAGYANWTAAETDADRDAARETMRSAGIAVGDAFLEFERGHNTRGSLSHFMQQRMPPSFYQAFERHVVLLRAVMVEAGGTGDPATPETAREQANLVLGSLDRVASCTPEGCRGNLVGTMAQAFLIVVREGFEAILLVGAVVAYLRKANRSERIPHVLWGVAAGIGASLVTWILLVQFLGVAMARTSATQSLLEGATMLLAAAVLFYVSFWLLSKVQVQRWQAYLDGKLEDSLSGDRAWLLGLVGFLAVFREGVETVLFLQALASQSAGAWNEIGAGLAVGTVALAGIYYAVHRAGVKVPLRAFFAITSALLYFLAIRFLGLGIFELQEANLLVTTPLPAVASYVNAHPLLGFLLQDVGGFAPTLEVALAQGVLLLALAVGGAWTWMRPQVASPSRG